MIKVSIKSDKDQISEIHVSGHSNYDVAGSDIVCAAVSTAMFISVGLIEKVCPKYDFYENENTATMKLKIIESNDFSNIILNNLIETLEQIEKDYTKYIKIKFEK